MKNKLYVLSSTVLASITLLACGGGNSPKPEIVVTGMSIELKDSSQPYYYAEKLDKSDLLVKLIYSDGTSKVLSDDNYKAYTNNYLKQEISFPYTLEYDARDFGKKSLFIETTDKKMGKSFEFDVEKYYKFEYSTKIGLADIEVTYNTADPTKFSFINKINSSKNVTYKSSKEDFVNVNTQTGEVTTPKQFSEFKSVVISGYVNGVKVDEYGIGKFSNDLTDMTIDSTEKSIKCSLSEDQRNTFYPNEGRLFMPSVQDTVVINNIETGGFKGCTKLISVTIPDTIIKIGESAFENCSGIEDTRIIYIPDNVQIIEPNAFKGTNCKYLFDDPYNWTWEEDGASGPVNPEYFSNSKYATMALADEYYCGCKYVKKIS